MDTAEKCINEVEWDQFGHWRVSWTCGDSTYGVSDYDLARARLSHFCLNPPEKNP